MTGRTSQKTITFFAEHFDIEAEAKVKARNQGKLFKTSEFFRWALENKVDEFISEINKEGFRPQNPAKYYKEKE